MNKKKLSSTIYIGSSIIILGEILLFLHVRPFSWFFTPIVWTGYIILIDGIVWYRRGKSLLSDRINELIIMIPFSIICWLIFEAYNVHIKNWHYEGLPDQLWIRWLGYGWSFATIFPGIFETADLIETFNIKTHFTFKSKQVKKSTHIILLILGIIFLIIPIIVSQSIAQYLAALIWIGFIFLLEPINYKIGACSIIRDIEKGKITKLFSLMLAGIVCGFLWEFWNFWAEARWVYDVPICQNLKIFEMVLPGYLGFIPFAVECYLMYHFCLKIFFVNYDDIYINGNI
jgi:hypothetical protein